MPKQQVLSHVAMSVPAGTLTDDFRARVLDFYGRVFGWQEMESLRLPDRLTIANDKVVSEEPLLTELNTRIRDVRVGPDGAVYVLTDSGTSSMSYGTPLASKLLKLTPK